jgi:Fe-S oxidoreductase
METVKGERFSDIRIEQMNEVGAEVLATACPYCISHFEDSKLAVQGEDEEGGLEVKDITEIIVEVME